MLVVGKGAQQTVDPQGGGSGLVIYKKNVEIAPIIASQIPVQITGDFLNGNITGTAVEWESQNSTYRIVASNGSYEAGGNNPYFGINSTNQPTELDGYGSNSGGLYQGGVYQGGPGSSNNTSNNKGGPGGDGTFGFGNGVKVTKGTIIPLTTIFKGNGKGGEGYGYGDQPYCGSGGGYSAGDEGGYNYGGGRNNRFKSDGTVSWIVLFYYHNDPL